jgi:fumarylacetoacetate (FAA) hydrolase
VDKAVSGTDGAAPGEVGLGTAVATGSTAAVTGVTGDIGAIAVSAGVGNKVGAALGASTVAGLGFTGFGGVTTSGAFSTTGVGSMGAGSSTMRVVKAVVCIDFLMLNWPLADVMIAKCAIKTITNSVANSVNQCFVCRGFTFAIVRGYYNSDMKLATYKDGSRDGQLIVVSRDLSHAQYATGIASRLQQALDDWNFISPQLQDVYDALNSGQTSRMRNAFPFDPKQCMAPLPRAYQWADGSAYLNHVELVRKARNSEVPASFYQDPLMYQGGSDDFIGPCDDIVCVSEAFGIDFESEVVVITGDVKMGSTPEQALDGIRLVMLANDVSLRNLIPDELAKGFGFVQSKPATAFSPVAVTLDELNNSWDKGRLNMTVQSTWNGRKVGMCEAGPEMTFHFGQLIAHLCKTRNVRAGSVIGSGTVSNKGIESKPDKDGKTRTDWPKGYSCIAEKRCIETIQDGKATTEFMKFGDTIRIEAKGKDGSSVFGAIEQGVVQAGT